MGVVVLGRFCRQRPQNKNIQKYDIVYRDVTLPHYSKSSEDYETLTFHTIQSTYQLDSKQHNCSSSSRFAFDVKNGGCLSAYIYLLEQWSTTFKVSNSELEQHSLLNPLSLSTNSQSRLEYINLSTTDLATNIIHHCALQQWVPARPSMSQLCQWPRRLCMMVKANIKPCY